MRRDRSREVEACDEFVQSAYQEYSLGTVANLLLPTGFLIDETTQYAGSFEKYVFLQGNKNEVYTRPEIDFIEKVGNIFVFRDFWKKTNINVVPCRVIVARIDFFDIVSAGISLNKISNKAMDGMNICLVIAEEGLLFTGTLFNQNNNDCSVSEIIQTEDQYDALVSELIFAPDYDGFVEYYSCIMSVLQYQEDIKNSSVRLSETRRIAYSYIEELQNLEKILQISFVKEIDRVFHASDKPEGLTYGDRVKECKEYLFNIESSRVNTMEMLFEAEEIERLASEAETKTNEMLQKEISGQEEPEDLVAETKALLDDPESMIKLLKKKRGL